MSSSLYLNRTFSVLPLYLNDEKHSGLICCILTDILWNAIECLEVGGFAKNYLASALPFKDSPVVPPDPFIALFSAALST